MFRLGENHFLQVRSLENSLQNWLKNGIEKKTEKMLQFTSNFTTCWLLLKAPGHFFGVQNPFFVNEGPHIVFKRASGTFFDRFGDPHHPQEGSWYHLRLIFGGFGRLAFLDFVAMANVS